MKRTNKHFKGCICKRCHSPKETFSKSLSKGQEGIILDSRSNPEKDMLQRQDSPFAFSRKEEWDFFEYWAVG